MKGSVFTKGKLRTLLMGLLTVLLWLVVGGRLSFISTAAMFLGKTILLLTSAAVHISGWMNGFFN